MEIKYYINDKVIEEDYGDFSNGPSHRYGQGYSDGSGHGSGFGPGSIPSNLKFMGIHYDHFGTGSGYGPGMGTLTGKGNG